MSKYLNPDISTSTTEARILQYESTDADGYPVLSTPKKVNGTVKTWVPYHNLGQCWYASVGIKYMFN